MMQQSLHPDQLPGETKLALIRYSLGRVFCLVATLEGVLR
jgi:hypothetical protein